jgi:hypothetical protein
MTFVVTDIEGSTKLWEWRGDIMDSSLDIHDRCSAPRRLVLTPSALTLMLVPSCKRLLL